MVNPLVDPTWRFMTLDWDGKIRMDCSSPYAMASLIARKDASYDIATGNDADADRHGIVTPDAGLMNPNHYLAVAIDYLYGHRAGWRAGRGAIGKTLVSLVDDRPGRRPTSAAGWSRCRSGSSGSCPGLLDGSFGFGGEESAGASFLRSDGTVWTTDKDGILLALLASEIMAVTGKSPSEHYAELTAQFGDPAYARVDAPADRRAEGRAGQALARRRSRPTELAGEPITAKLTAAPATARRSAASR